MPAGKAIYFRTVTTDAFQGPNMANYMADTMKVKSVYILDDSGAYGVGLANAYEAQAKKRGLTVMGHDQLDPKEADYTTILTKVKSMNPDALYYGGVGQAGVKVVKQSYDIMPKMIRAGGDGVYGAEILKGGGFPAAEGSMRRSLRRTCSPTPTRPRSSRRSPRNTASSPKTTRSPPMMPRSSSSTPSRPSPSRASRSTATPSATQSRPRRPRPCRAR